MNDHRMIPEEKIHRVYLTRRNLNALLMKLDRVRDGDFSFCAIVKLDAQHPIYPQTMPILHVCAVEDEDYYIDRKPGEMVPVDESRL